MTLTVRLLLLVALAVLPALLIEAYNEYDLRQDRAQQIRGDAVRIGDQTAAEMRQIIEGIQRVAVTLAQVPVIAAAASGDAHDAECSALLVKLRKNYPGDLGIGIANRDGLVVCTSSGVTTPIRVRGSHFQRALDTGAFVIGGYGASPTGQGFLSFAHPITAADGASMGAILIGLDLGWLSDHMRRRFAGVDAVVGLADRDLTYLMRLPDDATKLVGRAAPSGGAALAAMAGKGPVEAKGPDGVTRVAVIVPIAMSPDHGGKPDLLVAFGLSKDAAFKLIDAATNRALALLLVSLALALLAAWVGGRAFIRRPVERLLSAAARWQEGDYAARVGAVGRRNEFALLGRSFDTMAERIEERQRALRAEEERFRSLANLVPAIVWFNDPDGNIGYLNDRWYRYTGQTPEQAMPTGWANVIHPTDAERSLKVWTHAIASGEPYENEMRFRSQDGSYRWFLARAEPLRNEAGAITGWFGTSTDIDAIKRAEQHRTLLINELNHRVKNTLTTVQSIAAQSLRGADSEQGRAAFEARLLALSRTHDVLTRENWESASLRDIVTEVLQPHRGDGPPRFDVDGPALRIPPSMALPISMCLHELMTNAVKHGSLSTPCGMVCIRWSTETSDGGTFLSLCWQETGGPRVVPPKQKGFGSRLIERGLARELGGEIRIDYEESGVVCRLEAPLPEATRDLAEAA